MIIDFHTHTFPEEVAARAVEKLSHASHTVPFTDGTNAGLLRSMERNGIDVSVILPVATSKKQVKHINDRAIALNASQGWSGHIENSATPSTMAAGLKGRPGHLEHRAALAGIDPGDRGEPHAATQDHRSHKARLLSFAAMHPDLEDWEAELERVAAAGIPGIKIHPPYQGADLDDPRYLRVIRKADELSLITVTHTGYDIGMPGVQRCSPDMVRNIFDRLGDVRLVLAHMGGWRMWDEAGEKLADTPAILDTSFSTGRLSPLDDGYYKEDDLPLLQPDEFTDMVKKFGADRLLFGTDSPWSGQGESLRWIMGTELTDDEKKEILGENAAKLLKISD